MVRRITPHFGVFPVNELQAISAAFSVLCGLLLNKIVLVTVPSYLRGSKIKENITKYYSQIQFSEHREWVWLVPNCHCSRLSSWQEGSVRRDTKSLRMVALQEETLSQLSLGNYSVNLCPVFWNGHDVFALRQEYLPPTFTTLSCYFSHRENPPYFKSQHECHFLILYSFASSSTHKNKSDLGLLLQHGHAPTVDLLLLL